MKHAETATKPKVPSFFRRPSRVELLAKGKALRQGCPRVSHAKWTPAADRPSALLLVKRGDAGRIPELIPIRHGRMLQSPFTYYRGSALAMAVDLASLPRTGIRVQVCGDAHLGNFRCFATPERRVIFDIHDLDETLPAPWEWDLKRLATSFVVASRENGLKESAGAEAVAICVRTYRERLDAYTQMSVLDRWYDRLDIEDLIAEMADADRRRRAKRRLSKAKAQTALEYDFPKLVDAASEAPMIKDQPPLIYHMNGQGQKRFASVVQRAFADYRNTLSEERRTILDRYEFKDMTIKVVGVGSVGTYCAVILLMSGDADPLFLQVKQATPSALEPFAGRSLYENHGQRVVMGHRMMQSASDLFLGWTSGRHGRQFYIRQLRDVKIKFAVEAFAADEMLLFARWCGATLARAHARSGEPAMIAGYLGASPRFDEAMVDFATAYADQIEKDHAELRKAAKAGKLAVQVER